MKYKAFVETDCYKDFEFFEDGSGKYMIGKDASATPNDGWIPLYFTELEKEPTEEEIVALAVENDLVVEVYKKLHDIVMAKLGALQDRSDKNHSELRLIKKFADANKLDVIKDILAESENKK